MDAEYNDVQKWDYKELVTVFCGGPEAQERYGAKKYQIFNRGELEGLFADEDFATRKGLRFVEVYMPRDDAPTGLKMTAEASARNNAKTED